MLIILFGIFLLIVPLIFLSIIGAAFLKLGFSWREVLTLLFLTLIGSFINIPILTVKGEPLILVHEEIPFFGFFYRTHEATPTTTIAINVGGAVLPIGISSYLVYNAWIMLQQPSIVFFSFLGIAVVTFIVKVIARPVKGIGIVTPFFVPPLTAFTCGILLSIGTGEPLAAAIIAYVSGTIGTLLGADIANLHRIKEIGAPLVSIGGAGTFDGIFLTGVIAAFLA